jgi:hypothetical protein
VPQARKQGGAVFFCSSKLFSSQLSDSCRFAAKLLWFTARTSPPARVCVAEPAHGNDAAIFACVTDTAKRAQHNRDIKIFYHYQEEFSINFHIFIHENHACPISLRQRMYLFAKANKKGALARTNVRAKLPLKVSSNEPTRTTFTGAVSAAAFPL